MCDGCGLVWCGVDCEQCCDYDDLLHCKYNDYNYVHTLTENVFVCSYLKELHVQVWAIVVYQSKCLGRSHIEEAYMFTVSKERCLCCYRRVLVVCRTNKLCLQHFESIRVFSVRYEDIR